MPAFSVKKSVDIDASLTSVLPHVADFNNWTAWSPWLLMEPEARVTVRSDTKYYEWEGERVGSGNMELLKQEESDGSTILTYSLNFLKPWKSYADVKMILTPVNGATKLTWTMDSTLPFFLFWMKKMMIAFIGMDYQRGLNMLKEMVELGKVNSSLDFQGISDFKGASYIGVKTNCSQTDMAEMMARDFRSLEEYMDNHQELGKGDTLSIYHKWDIVKGTAEYTAAITVDTLPENLPANMYSGTIPLTKVFTLRHTGSYEHLANAWGTVYTMERNKEFKCAKNIHPFEIYQNSPNDTESNQLVTDVTFPIR